MRLKTKVRSLKKIKKTRKKKKMEQTIIGYKSLAKLSVLPVVSSAIATTTNLYDKLKNTNLITRTSFDIAEISFQIFTRFVALPLINMAKNPSKYENFLFYYYNFSFNCFNKKVDRVDNFVSDKIDIITEKSTKLKTTVTDTYDYQVKRINNIKFEAQTRSKQLRDFMTTCFIFINSVLENKYVKLVTEPVLNFTENSINHVLPMMPQQSNIF